MIKLYQFKSAFGLPNMSPFCMKAETWLRMAGLEYETVLVTNPRKTPKGKAPYLEDNGTVIADSTFMLKYLQEQYAAPLDDGVTATERATAHAFGRMLEERFYWALVYSRWIDERGWSVVRDSFFSDLPPVLRTLVPALVRRSVRSDLHHHGIGRHDERDIYRLAADDLASLAGYLGDKPYFLGDKPTSIDATVYAFVANTVQTPLETPIQQAVREYPNLAVYAERMRQRYFSDMVPDRRPD